MIKVRRETGEDIAAIHLVNELAFGHEQEADLVDALRQRGAVTLSLVAVAGDDIVGHILFTPVTVVEGDSRFGAVALAPMAVLPGHQGEGVGAALVRAGLEECRRLGNEIVFVLGHSDYYPRFGFVQALPLGLECEFNIPEEYLPVWMVLELKPGALSGRKGTVRFQPEFAAAV